MIAAAVIILTQRRFSRHARHACQVVLPCPETAWGSSFPTVTFSAWQAAVSAPRRTPAALYRGRGKSSEAESRPTAARLARVWSQTTGSNPCVRGTDLRDANITILYDRLFASSGQLASRPRGSTPGNALCPCPLGRSENRRGLRRVHVGPHNGTHRRSGGVWRDWATGDGAAAQKDASRVRGAGNCH